MRVRERGKSSAHQFLLPAGVHPPRQFGQTGGQTNDFQDLERLIVLGKIKRRVARAQTRHKKHIFASRIITMMSDSALFDESLRAVADERAASFSIPVSERETSSSHLMQCSAPLISSRGNKKHVTDQSICWPCFVLK